jgi:hypothetical protein
MPGLFSQRRGTNRTLQVSVCSVVTRFAVLWVFYITLCIFYIILCIIVYYSMYYFILFYVTFECICVQTTATGYLPNCKWQIYQYQWHPITNKLHSLNRIYAFMYKIPDIISYFQLKFPSENHSSLLVQWRHRLIWSLFSVNLDYTCLNLPTPSPPTLTYGLLKFRFRNITFMYHCFRRTIRQDRRSLFSWDMTQCHRIIFPTFRK